MSKITRARQVLAVTNLEQSARYFQNVLGFDLRAQYPGWTFLSRGACFLMLGECPDETPASSIGDHAYVTYLDVEDANSLYEEFTAKGAQFCKQLRDEPWGMREFGVVTIDGHKFMFGQSLDS